MKKRRTLIVALTLVAAIFLGVGYAAVSTSLEIAGTAELNIDKLNDALDADVYFTKVSTGETLSADASTAYTDSTTGNTASILTTNNDKGSFTAKDLSSVGDVTYFTYEIKNEGTSAVELSYSLLESPYPNGSDFSTTVTFANTTLAAGGTTTVTVKLVLDDLPDATCEASFTFNLVATAN